MRKYLFIVLHTLLWGAVLFVLPLALGSCSMYSYLSDTKHEEVEFVLPQWPENLPPLKYWRVELYCAHKEECTELQVQAGQQSFVQKVIKNTPLAVCAYPVTQNQIFFHCAGAVYPAGCTEEKPHFASQELSWSQGFAAVLLQNLIKSASQSGSSAQEINDYICQFNWKKLVQTLQDRQNEESAFFYNPWLLDMSQVLEGIAYKNFTATKLRLSGVFSAHLDFPVYSPYVPENEQSLAAVPATCVTLRKNTQSRFELPGTAAGQRFFIIIYGSSEKNMSLELISMPI